MRARSWAGMAVAALLCVGFARYCVRIVPADAPMASGGEGPVDNGALLIPVEGVPPSALADTFTQARAGGARPHDAIDIMAARGRAVLAVADGRVEKIFWSDQGGRTLYQRSGDGRRLYYYAHLDRYAPGLREGQAVRRGQSIATVGSTGNADPGAPHLHFAVHAVRPGEPWYGGRPINPYPLLATR
ncbi:MAG TPA: peptidase M23 [Sphingobium sp.]|uniref:M23 family metallopeptidase n=1 Tax=Sphingobium sp. TaxID=1912891 RepID=UPI000EF0F4C9|nr:M23 family metallopeptidase [Sphingobium sp.]HAF40733.1 peptidase M23 [Sphingobium sp.]